MEQQQKAAASATKPISKILKFLPRATSSVSFQNPPLYSPVKEKRSSEKTHKSNLGIGFSGPLVSMIPATAGDNNRRKIKNDSNYALVYEPTSPRVSCMGQVKCKHYRKKLAAAAAAGNKLPPTFTKPTNKVLRTTSFTTVPTHYKENDQEKSTKVVEPVVKNKKKSGIRGLFRGGSVNAGAGRKSDVTNNKSKTTELNVDQKNKGPCLSTMKRFSSGRDAFSNFDWTTQVAPLDSAGHRNYFTDDDHEIKVPSSAPIMERTKGVCDDFVRVGGVNLEPRKEINLWKRRTMAQPKPLQLQTV